MHLNDGRVVSNFIVRALRNEPITVYGKGRQTRSFCYVSDTTDALVRLMASDEDFTGPGLTINGLRSRRHRRNMT